MVNSIIVRMFLLIIAAGYISNVMSVFLFEKSIMPTNELIGIAIGVVSISVLITRMFFTF